ncbi:6386_t:CDS:10 [Scutellospora calospora]|uniref:6386_t:CDS:1 n=1 Tax=Scutellospora calospora TaxID=85575 RepID=A0ACA9K892_9GLOM|nr:6386_t:CDS:10 [Scutellospora calospora]
MSKRPYLSVKLISLGQIIPNIHYGTNSHYWWRVKNDSLIEEGIFLYPVRIGWQTLFEQNNKRFYMHITEGHKHNEIEPGYRCQTGSNYSSIEITSSLAVISLYQKLFPSSKTKFSGPYVLGWDDDELLELSLESIQFRPFAFKVKKYLVYITSLGIGNNINMMRAGIGFMSSFFGEFKKKRTLFVQTIEKDNCQKNVGLYKKFRGTQLFGLEHSLTQKIISNQYIPTCIAIAWNNEIVMNSIPIIELRKKLQQLYPPQYVLSERELCAWRTMLKASGCTNISPFEKGQSEYEFWSRSSTSNIDQNTLQLLYNSGFIHTTPNYVIDISNKFWKCFQKSLNNNKNRIDVKIRILSIIANEFSYDELQKNFKVSSKTIAKARAYCNINGPGSLMHNKPTITRVRISEESEKQFEYFFSDKNIVNLSSYKVDKYGLPLKYLKDQKETLTTFLTRLKDGPYCYKNDLGGLCLTCAEYGYNVFDNLKELINKKIENKNEQIAHAIKRYIRLGYNINEGDNIVKAISNIKGTSVANIQPNRNYKNIKKPKLTGISNWFEFKWPIDCELTGFICARALPHFGTWNNFSPVVISKSRDEIEQPKPSPKVSDHTIIDTPWVVSLPSNSPDPTRLSISEIKRELEQRGLSYNTDENKTNLISLLKENIQQETSNMIKEMKDAHELCIVINDEGGGKHMTETVKEILKSFFHASDEDKSERYTAKEMLQDLQQRKQMEELEAEEIPNLKTIEN